MSFRGLLKHRVTVRRLQESNVDGIPVHTYVQVASQVPCFLDLNFVRLGKDPTWSPEAGRSSDRTGVAFFGPRANIRIGDIVECTRGPAGSFSLGGAIDEAWTPRRLHHYEVSITEVPRQVAAGYNA